MDFEVKKRPRDPNQLGKLIIDIATGQIEDRPPTPEEQGKDPAAVALGRPCGLMMNSSGGRQQPMMKSQACKKNIKPVPCNCSKKEQL